MCVAFRSPHLNGLVCLPTPNIVQTDVRGPQRCLIFPSVFFTPNYSRLLWEIFCIRDWWCGPLPNDIRKENLYDTKGGTFLQCFLWYDFNDCSKFGNWGLRWEKWIICLLDILCETYQERWTSIFHSSHALSAFFVSQMLYQTRNTHVCSFSHLHTDTRTHRLASSCI